MMHVLLVILKWIGIVLAVVLGLLLFLFLIFMLGPIRYSALGEKTEKISAEGNISWLFFVLRCKIKYSEAGFVWYFRIFGFLFASNDPEYLVKKQERKDRREAKAKQETLPEVKGFEDVLPEPVGESANIPLEIVKEPANTPPEIVKEPANIPAKGHETVKKKRRPKKPSKGQKIKQTIRKVKRFIVRFKKKILSIPQKVTEIKDKCIEKKEKLSSIKEFFVGEQNKAVMKYLLAHFKKMLLHILPNKLRGHIELGLEDPYTMGQILAVLGILMPIYQDKLTVIPDFEETRLEGNFSLKGTIIPGYLILQLLILILNKEVQRVIKEGRKLLGGNA